MKAIIITGASRGIGAATARLAAEQGYAVVINYKTNKGAAEAVVADITSRNGFAVSIQANIAEEAEVVRLFNEVDKLFGNLTCLINNASVLEEQCQLEDISYARLNRIFTTNVFSSFICTREAIKRMSFKYGNRGGSIVNVSSLAAKTGAPNEYVDYAASKGAIETLTVGLSKELANEGIRVNGVRPAFIYTGIHTSGGDPGRIERLKNSIPMQRGGLAEEVAEAIMWLASEKSSYTTGAFIEVTGGK